MKISENALKVLESRYLLRDENGDLCESPEQLFNRVAETLADVEDEFDHDERKGEIKDIFHELLTSFDFLPNSPTLMNAGTSAGQLSACFCLPVEDSVTGIFDSLKNMALIQKTGGGTGFSFSSMRPKGSVVKSTGGKAAGPVAFMKIFNEATEHIKQGGKRRGANMAVLRVDHPDIMDFIYAKVREGQLENFNLSVGITDEFMDALEKDSYTDLTDPVTKKVTGRIKAKTVFGAICEAAWKCGDPGLLFLDTINKSNPLPHSGTIEATNPCGEVPLLPYESCNLGSVNLSNMLKSADNGPVIDWEKLGRTVRYAVRFLDNVIEVNKFPLRKAETVTKRHRKIGLGVMGFADMLIRLQIPYNSQKAINMAEDLMSFIYRTALEASAELAGRRGPFPAWETSVYSKRGIVLRNATVTSIAPTGTISIIAGTSSGIEPLFALGYYRKNVLEGQDLFEVNPVFLDYCRKYGVNTDSLLKKLNGRSESKDGPVLPGKLRDIFMTALEIDYEQHIKMQAAFQKYVDNSVSKTVNLSHDKTVDDVKAAYLLAYRLGCKGVTVFRYGSKNRQVLELANGEKWFEKEYSSKCDPHECKL